MMKRIVAFLLTFAVTFGLLLGFSAGAEEELPPLYVKHSINQNRDTLTVELYTDGLKWTAIDFGVRFDPSVLTLSAVSVGSKILTAQERGGYEFLTMHRDIAASNSAGFCNFVAAVGSESCRMTAYAGPIVIYTFGIKDKTKAKAAFDVCVATLVDKDGKTLLNHTPYGPTDTPVTYQTESANLFRYGDLNRDGVDVFDAMMIMQYVVGSLQLNEYQLAAAKVCGESDVSVFDAMMIMQYVVGSLNRFPAES